MLLGRGDPVSWILGVVPVSEALPHPHKPQVELEILVFYFPNCVFHGQQLCAHTRSPLCLNFLV